MKRYSVAKTADHHLSFDKDHGSDSTLTNIM